MLILLNDVDQCIDAMVATRFERFVARARGAKLDRELATGISPDSSPALALRAQALVQPSTREALAQRVEQLVEEASRGRIPRPSAARVPIRRAGVLDAADVLRVLIDHLRARGPVPARGVAQVRVLLTDGSGPLYYPGGDLRTRVMDAIGGLEPLRNWWPDA